MDKNNIRRIGGTMTHGTAKQVLIPSVIPQKKDEKEKFWIEQLIPKLDNYYEIVKEIKSNDDDANGQDDVIITLNDKQQIGMQLTEFTFELERARKGIKNTYITNILKLIQQQGLSFAKKVIFSIKVPYSNAKKPELEKPEKIVKDIEDLIITNQVLPSRFLQNGKMIINVLNDYETIFVPSINNIGISVDFDNIPTGLEMYKECTDLILNKKSSSKSKWLVIWSLDFWRDSHWLKDEVIDYMSKQFSTSIFDEIYFMESMDGENIFQVNLHIYKIK